MNPTKEQMKAGLQIILAFAEAIRDLGTVPSGHLYARMMGKFSLDEYMQIIDILKKQGLVEEEPSHLLRWVGPAK